MECEDAYEIALNVLDEYDTNFIYASGKGAADASGREMSHVDMFLVIDEPLGVIVAQFIINLN